MNRTFVLPLSALVLGSTACNGGAGIDENTEDDSEGTTAVDTDTDTDAPSVDGLVGDWDATRVQFGEYDYSLPIEYTYGEGTDSYTSSQSISLAVTPALASIVSTQTTTDANGDIIADESYSDSYSGTWSSTAERSYTIAIDDGEDSVELACTIDASDDLECTATIDNTVLVYSFERRPE